MENKNDSSTGRSREELVEKLTRIAYRIGPVGEIYRNSVYVGKLLGDGVIKIVYDRNLLVAVQQQRTREDCEQLKITIDERVEAGCGPEVYANAGEALLKLA